jgi:aminoglycoside phosphotransferase (APT) family kinase protein
VADRRLAHGYTNESWLDGELVVKQYGHVDAAERLRTEIAALARVAGIVPVPGVVRVDPANARAEFTYVPGRHGQELINEGHAVPVLAAAGQTLRRLHDGVPGFVHGDYGPQNLLLDPVSLEVVAVLDWEFAHDGDPVEDLAWTEWIVRMHHANSAHNLPALFRGYGWRPAWPLRHAAMQNRCTEFREICLRRGDQAAAGMWRSREQLTRNWRE